MAKAPKKKPMKCKMEQISKNNPVIIQMRMANASGFLLAAVEVDSITACYASSETVII